MRTVTVNAAPMEPDDPFAKRPDDPVILLARQDIDRLSVDELDERISALQAEIARCQSRKERSVNHRATAEGLFKR